LDSPQRNNQRKAANVPIKQKAFGAYYTRPEITEYLCERTVNRLILDAVNHHELPGLSKARQYDSIVAQMTD
jgi:hypothetical protein